MKTPRWQAKAPAPHWRARIYVFVGQALSPANQFFSVIWTGVFNGAPNRQYHFQKRLNLPIGPPDSRATERVPFLGVNAQFTNAMLQLTQLRKLPRIEHRNAHILRPMQNKNGSKLLDPITEPAS